ncbi:uncharacterized protein BX663DRAFT_532330 [Cokeromyces recurvatus]|uniref:uncharacterized protein n=1 Tax=Cokeromyces recurvatus TaxID=90255 RepID=UPI0022207EFB|nr:uncharacterized protein BX663DRAFT_532330 [Cokeromyces recurvatus]KAI7900395.1 hypothetical protein BX663DRAFT_532330 [Cokeromyces recurvatus]
MFCLTEHHLSDNWFTHVSYPLELPIPSIPENSVLVGFAQAVYGMSNDLNIKGPIEKSRDIVMYHLPVVLQILINIWKAFRKPQWDHQVMHSIGDVKVDAILHSFSYAADQAKQRLQSIFEKLFKYSTADFVEGLTEIFYIENPVALEFDETVLEEAQLNEVALEILDSTPNNTPQHVISTLLDSIRQRTPNISRTRRRRILRQGKLTDTSILRFAEIYCSHIKDPESIVLLWPMIHSFSKDYLSQANTYKALLPSLMRFLTVSLEEISKSTNYEQDKRIRKDAQDLYQRCIDYCILISGKSIDQSLWVRGRSAIYDEPVDDNASVHTVDSIDTYKGHTMLTNNSNLGGALIPTIQQSTDTKTTGNVSINSVSEMEKKTIWKLKEDSMINHVNQYLANQVIPRLRLLIGDNDKINSLLNNLVYYVIGPSLKSKV